MGLLDDIAAANRANAERITARLAEIEVEWDALIKERLRLLGKPRKASREPVQGQQSLPFHTASIEVVDAEPPADGDSSDSEVRELAESFGADEEATGWDAEPPVEEPAPAVEPAPKSRAERRRRKEAATS